jgi:hypothetical protein
MEHHPDEAHIFKLLAQLAQEVRELSRMAKSSMDSPSWNAVV